MRNKKKDVAVIEVGPFRKGKPITPPTPEMKLYTDHATGIETQLLRSCNELGARVRKEVILPICKRLGLTFLSGNGTFFFVYENLQGRAPKIDDIYFGREDDFNITADPELNGLTTTTLTFMKNVLMPILDMLNHEVYSHECIGYFVDGVKKEDYK